MSMKISGTVRDNKNLLP